MATFTAKIDYKVIDSGKNAVNYDLSKDLSGELTLEQLLMFTKGALIRIAKDALIEEQGRGFDKNPTVIVDNKFNRKEIDVNPLGKIEYVARAEFKSIIREVYRKILYYSKIRTGRYFDHNIVTYNKRVVATTPVELDNWLNTITAFGANDIVRFMNPLPYARKLERLGITRQGRKVKQVQRKKKKSRVTVTMPNGAYAQAFNATRRRFNKNLKMYFDILPGPLLGIDNPDYRFKKGRAKERPYLFPSIALITEFSGLTNAGPRGILQ
jgi:hypothetical protein